MAFSGGDKRGGGGDRTLELDPFARPDAPAPDGGDDPLGGGFYGGPAPGSEPVVLDDPNAVSLPSGYTGGPAAPPVEGPVDSNQDVTAMPSDQIGDIPPPPAPSIPAPPVRGVGVAGLPGTEGSTFARPGMAAAARFRTPAFLPQRPPRFGPGVPMAGGGTTVAPGGDEGMLDPERAAELLRSLAGGQG